MRLGPHVVTQGTTQHRPPLVQEAGLQAAALRWARCAMTGRPPCCRSLGPLLRHAGTVTASPPRGSCGATRHGLALGTVKRLSQLTVSVTETDSRPSGSEPRVPHPRCLPSSLGQK